MSERQAPYLAPAVRLVVPCRDCELELRSRDDGFVDRLCDADRRHWDDDAKKAVELTQIEVIAWPT